MKKKEVIAEVAFLGVPPDVQMEGEQEFQEGFTIKPLTTSNRALIQADTIKQILELAIPDSHDDDEIGPNEYTLLSSALARFRDQVLDAMLFPQMKTREEDEFAQKIALLEKLSQGDQ